MVRGRKSYVLQTPKNKQEAEKLKINGKEVTGGMITVRLPADLHKRFAYLCRNVLNVSINQKATELIVREVNKICHKCNGDGLLTTVVEGPEQRTMMVTCDHCEGKKLFEQGQPPQS